MGSAAAQFVKNCLDHTNMLPLSLNSGLVAEILNDLEVLLLELINSSVWGW
jgi:hypothetical protein